MKISRYSERAWRRCRCWPLRIRRRPPIFHGRSTRACGRSWPTTTGPGSTSASTAATAGARSNSPRSPADFSTSPKGSLVGGTVGFNYQVGSLGLGPRGRLRLGRHQGTASPAAPSVRDQEHLARHRARPRRLCLRPLAALLHRRAALRQASRHRQRPAAPSMRHQHRLDRRRRPRIRLPRQLVGQDRISLCRSRHLRPAAVSICTSATTSDFTANIIRAGLNYKFSGPIFSRF